jgi:hypothetical protein
LTACSSRIVSRAECSKTNDVRAGVSLAERRENFVTDLSRAAANGNGNGVAANWRCRQRIKFFVAANGGEREPSGSCRDKKRGWTQFRSRANE